MRIQIYTYMTLGFDASTTTCGFAFYNGKVIEDAGFVDISKCISNKEKTLHVISTIDSHPLIKSTTKINLEAALSGFMGGRTSQQVIIKLARFNAVFEYIISEHFKIPVNLIGASTARKTVFGKSRISGIKPKEYVLSELTKMMDLSKFNKINKIGNVDKKCGDMYDAMVLSMA
jgi:hypothetical protein